MGQGAAQVQGKVLGPGQGQMVGVELRGNKLGGQEKNDWANNVPLYTRLDALPRPDARNMRGLKLELVD